MRSILTGEAIRQGWISFGVVAVSLAAGTSVSNERAVFIPISGVENAITASVRAFAALAIPGPVRVYTLYVAPVQLGGLPQQPIVQRVELPTLGLENGQTPGSTPFAGQPDPAFGQAVDAEVAAAAQAAADAVAANGSDSITLASLGRTPPGNYNGVSNVPGDNSNPNPPTPPTAVPETGSWVMMILGFGLIGALQRRIGRARRLAQVWARLSA
jgi:hypothetical protein